MFPTLDKTKILIEMSLPLWKKSVKLGSKGTQI